MRLQLWLRLGCLEPPLCAMYLYWYSLQVLNRLGTNQSAAKNLEAIEKMIVARAKLLLPECVWCVDDDVQEIVAPAPAPKRRKTMAGPISDEFLADMMAETVANDKASGAVDLGSMSPLQREMELYKGMARTQAKAKAAEIAAARRTGADQVAFEPPMAFYNSHQHVLPNLRKLALHFLAQPSSSADAERAFSVSGSLQSKRRARMSKDMLEAQLMLVKNSPAVTQLISGRLKQVFGVQVSMSILRDARRGKNGETGGESLIDAMELSNMYWAPEDAPPETQPVEADVDVHSFIEELQNIALFEDVDELQAKADARVRKAALATRQHAPQLLVDLVDDPRDVAGDDAVASSVRSDDGDV